VVYQRGKNVNIVLIGYRCSGKTTIGELLSQATGRLFLDTDRMCEEESGLAIPEMIRTFGWKKFRKLEESIIKKVSEKDVLIVSTGGGVVLVEKNVRRLKRNGWIVWLNASVNTLRQRMLDDIHKGNARPGLTGGDPVEEVGKVLQERNPLYSDASDFRLDTDDLHISRVADRILSAMPSGEFRVKSRIRRQAHVG
jgi:shikimate kinase